MQPVTFLTLHGFSETEHPFRPLLGGFSTTFRIPGVSLVCFGEYLSPPPPSQKSRFGVFNPSNPCARIDEGFHILHVTLLTCKRILDSVVINDDYDVLTG